MRWRTSIRCVATLLLLILLTVPVCSASERKNISGTWQGSVEGVQFPLFVLHVVDTHGKLSVSCDLPERGFWNLPGANASLTSNDFRFDLPCWNDSHYLGTLDRTGKLLTGRIKRDDGLSRVLVLKYTSEEVPPAPSSEIEGDWFGLLRSPNYPSLRLSLHVRRSAMGKLTVAFDDVDRANMAVPCENVGFDGRNFSFEIPAWHAKFAATLDPNGGTLGGFWNQWQKLPLKFEHQRSKAIELMSGSKVPAAAPVPLDALKAILDRELAPLLNHGVLANRTGGGVVVGIIDHGRRRIFGYGTAHPDSIFEIGSITKTFTGLTLAQMVEQNSVTLEEPVRLLLPAEIIPESGPGGAITLLDLATHHSGLPRLPDNLGTSPDAFASYDLVKLRDFFAARSSIRKPRPTFSYSNFGVGLLGYALARRAGYSYGQLVQVEVTGPLKFKNTVVTLSAEQKRRLIQGYNPALDPTDAGAWDHPFFEGAGSLKSTATDLLDYLNANLDPDALPTGAPPGSPAATLPAAIALDHVLRSDAWEGAKVAMDWIYDEKSQNFGHGGGTTSYSSLVLFSPPRDRAVVVLYNRLDDTPGQERLVDRIAENIDELMSGKPARPIYCYPDSEGALVAAAGR